MSNTSETQASIDVKKFMMDTVDLDDRQFRQFTMCMMHYIHEGELPLSHPCVQDASPLVAIKLVAGKKGCRVPCVKIHKPPPRSDVPYVKIVTMYHDILSDLPQIRNLNENLKRQLHARWNEAKERQNMEWWDKYFTYVRDRCPFLMGSTNWTASLRWLVKKSNMIKVEEGEYER